METTSFLDLIDQVRCGDNQAAAELFDAATSRIFAAFCEDGSPIQLCGGKWMHLTFASRSWPSSSYARL